MHYTYTEAKPMSAMFDLRAMSKTYQDVAVLLYLLERYDRLLNFAKTGALPGFMSGEGMREWKSEIERSFMRLNSAEQNYVVNYRLGRHRQAARWYERHMRAHPGDWKAMRRLLISHSPWWQIVAVGARDRVDSYMERRYPNWNAARSAGDTSLMDSLLRRELRLLSAQKQNANIRS